MAEAETLTNLTPKQMGRHLRAVRRKKGLSLSEVARGAGLTRREMNAYEKGRVPVPDSDLFVIAGACGVEVSELRPPTGRAVLPEVPSGNGVARADAGLFPSSIQDVISRLRRERDGWPLDQPALEPHAVHHAIEAPEAPPQRAAPAPAEPVDVFAELARLPEPLPLPPREEEPDLFAARLDTLPPFGAVEEVDDVPLGDWSIGDGSGEDGLFGGEADKGPVLVELPATDPEPPETASDAPPIDVAARVEAFESGWGWDPNPGTEGPGTEDPGPRPDDRAGSPELPLRQPGSAFTDSFTTDSFTDRFRGDPVADPFAGPADDAAIVPAATDPWAATRWPEEAWPTCAPAEADADHSPSGAATDSPGLWEHEPDPAATSTGFFVDWGQPEDGAASGPQDHGSAAALPDPPLIDLPDWVAEFVSEPIPEEATEAGAAGDARTEEASREEQAGGDGGDAPVPSAPVDEPPLISWRPVPDAFDTTVREPALTGTAVAAGEQFVVAGPEWQIGNAVPLVEVRSTGSLVMRRADERWALADVTAAEDFTVEAYVDLRSGPGFGVLFRASVDCEGRMSGYSFDIDPVYGGGSYLVREWRADRELWNPIAHVPMPDPTRLRGLLAVRLTVEAERLVAAVNGETVLTVDSLRQASADRGRDGATGDRVGIQAWSSTDLVIEEVRVARR